MARPDADIFLREVQADVRREQLWQLWRRVRPFVLGGAVAVVVVVGGGIGYRQYRLAQLRDWGEAYSEVLDAVDERSLETAMAALSPLREQAGASYAWLARFQEASLLSRLGQKQEAGHRYEYLSLYAPSRPLRELALLLWVHNDLDDGAPQALQERLTPLLEADGVWRYSAGELLAFLALRQGQKEEARRIFLRLAEEGKAPPGLKARAGDMAEYLQRGGGDGAAEAP